MIGPLVSLLSLEMTRRLVAAGLVFSSLTITAATNATPIVVTTSTAHGFIRPTHAWISGVAGNTAANGAWVLTPVGETRLRLSSYDLQGAPVVSAGSAAYSSGGTIQTAFPDGSILLGRRNVAMQMAVATPRIVFVPVGSPAWTLDPYGGVGATGAIPRSVSGQTAEQKTMALQRQIATEKQRFEVHVTGSAVPSDPDFGDFDVTQTIYQTLYSVMFDVLSSPRVAVLSGDWVSQRLNVGQLDSRGQKWVGMIEIMQPVVQHPLAFIQSIAGAGANVQHANSFTSADASDLDVNSYIPSNTVSTIIVQPDGASSSDTQTIIVPVIP